MTADPSREQAIRQLVTKAVADSLAATKDDTDEVQWATNLIAHLTSALLDQGRTEGQPPPHDEPIFTCTNCGTAVYADQGGHTCNTDGTPYGGTRTEGQPPQEVTGGTSPGADPMTDQSREQAIRQWATRFRIQTRLYDCEDCIGLLILSELEALLDHLRTEGQPPQETHVSNLNAYVRVMDLPQLQRLLGECEGRISAYEEQNASLRQQLAEAQQARDEWKDAIIDAAIVDWIYTKEHETNPRKAVNDLLAWQVKLALDPAVSKEAHDMVQRAEAAEAVVASLRQWVTDNLPQKYVALLDEWFASLPTPATPEAEKPLQRAGTGDN